jgi:hypothetical protein
MTAPSAPLEPVPSVADVHLHKKSVHTSPEWISSGASHPQFLWNAGSKEAH